MVRSGLKGMRGKLAEIRGKTEGSAGSVAYRE